MAPLFIFIFLLVSSSSSAVDITDSEIGTHCGSSTFNDAKITSNINKVLADLVARASIGGFATLSYGSGSSEIYGLAQCRGDVSDNDCSTCLAEAAKMLPSACPSQTDALVWYDFCVVRYANTDFIGQSDQSFALILFNTQNATDPEKFDKAVSQLMVKVEAMAVAPGSGGLGRDMKQFLPDITIYGLAQCTRDLQPLTCAQCLSSAVALFPNYCQYRQGCRVLYSSCIVRYEIYPFFFPLVNSGNDAAIGGQYSKVILKP